MINLSETKVYDIETLPNCITLAMEDLYSDTKAVWEISQFRDDRASLLQFFQYLAQMQIPMLGFNNNGFDYPVIHEFWKNPNITYQQLYAKSQQIIDTPWSQRHSNTIWADSRFTPQIDLMTINHFDNVAKMTGLKALEINMRSPNVVEMPVPVCQPISPENIDKYLIPYNFNDVSETKKFALHTIGTVEFRNGLIDQFGVDVLNWNDTKIGENMLIKELGDELCFDRTSGRKVKRQTPRYKIPIKDVIFPYVQFENGEFNRVLHYLKNQVLKTEDFKEEEVGKIVTKGVFKGLTASVGGLDFHFGVGGIHASMDGKRVLTTEEWLIVDIDVKSLYPSIAIVNKLAPEHLGAPFVQAYATLPVKRAEWQEKKGKKCAEANSFKLASNGAYGKSNSVYSPLYDPKFTMTITLNGQLLLCMLAEKLVKVPTIQLIQANTDGITYYIHRDYKNEAEKVCREWENATLLVLEDVDYSAMFIRDVNNYIAVGTDGEIKLKGAYWTPDPVNYHSSIANAQPPAWHKNLSNPVSIRAAVAHMLHGVDLMLFLKTSLNPYDFLCVTKIKGQDKLLWGGLEQQRNTRYYVSKQGGTLIKKMPPQGPLGMFKRGKGVNEAQHLAVMEANGGVWDETVCTKNRSKYDIRENSIAAGHNVTVCNNIEDFDFDNVNYDWYLQEALKLVI